MIRTKTSHRERHIVNHTLRADISLKDKISTMLCFSQHVRDTISIHRFTLVIRINIHVCIRVCRSHHRRNSQSVHLGLRLLQVVTAVIITAGQCSSQFWMILTSSFGFTNNYSTRTILGMTCRMEPRFTVTATVDAVEFQGSIANHGINFITYNECTRNIISDFNTKTSLSGQPCRKMSNLNGSRRTRKINFIAQLVVSCRISTCHNTPIRRCCFGARQESTSHLRRKRFSFNVNHLKRRRRPHIEELLFRIFFEISRLVHTNRRYMHVHGIQISLIQSIRYISVRHIRSRGTILGHHVVLMGYSCIELIKN